MDQKQIEEALNNIKELRLTIDNNFKKLKPFLISKKFLDAILHSTIVLILLSILIFFSDKNFSYFSNYPIYLKIVIIALFIYIFLYLAIKKFFIINKVSDLTLLEIFNLKDYKEVLIKILLSLFFSFLIFFILKEKTNIEGLLLPIIFINYGILINVTANMFSVKELDIAGYLIIGQGVLTLYFLNDQLLLWTVLNITFAFLIIYLALLVAYKRKK